MIDPGSVPLERVLGAEVGAFYRDVHATTVSRCCSGPAWRRSRARPRCEQVRTVGPATRSSATSWSSASASRPRTELAEAPGSTIDNGIVVDECLQTTAPGVFAAGDVANAWHPFFERQIRVEHWANALNQGPAAAAVDARPHASPTTASPTSTPTSTTSAWSTAATPPTGTRSSSAVTVADRRVHRLLAEGPARRRPA